MEKLHETKYYHWLEQNPAQMECCNSVTNYIKWLERMVYEENLVWDKQMGCWISRDK